MNLSREIKQSNPLTRIQQRYTLSSGAHYYFNDLDEIYVTLNKEDVKGYRLPSLSSSVDAMYDVGNKIKVYSFLVVNGKLWLQYDNHVLNRMNYIPFDGDPGDDYKVSRETLNSVIYNPPIFTVEEQAAQQEEEEKGPLDGLITAITGVGTILLIGYVVNIYSKFKKS